MQQLIFVISHNYAPPGHSPDEPHQTRRSWRRPVSTSLWLTLYPWPFKDGALIASTWIYLSSFRCKSTFLKGFFDRAFDLPDKSTESLSLAKNRIFIKDLIPDFSTNAGKTVSDPEMMPVFSSTALIYPSQDGVMGFPQSEVRANSREDWKVGPLIELVTWFYVNDQEDDS